MNFLQRHMISSKMLLRQEILCFAHRYLVPMMQSPICLQFQNCNAPWKTHTEADAAENKVEPMTAIGVIEATEADVGDVDL